jgi:alpha-ketoglutarate-dependent 2,4-dichlorophenoxyacetate dioxygenase
MTLTTTQLHPHFAAEVRGLDMRRDLGPEPRRQVEALIDRYGVLVFRDQPADDEAQMAFSAQFGPLQRSITTHRPDAARRFKQDTLSDISNVDEKGESLAPTDLKRRLQLANLIWHTDNSFRSPAGKFTFLAARILPPEGGETEFADARMAYDALPDAMKQRLGDLSAVHSLARSREIVGAPPLSPQEARNLPPTAQPVVRVHPSTGRRSLFLGSHASHIAGWPMETGRALIDELNAHITRPEFVYRHIWAPGDLVMWDNRSTLHRARPFDEVRFKRDLRRTSIAEDQAASPAGGDAPRSNPQALINGG